MCMRSGIAARCFKFVGPALTVAMFMPCLVPAQSVCPIRTVRVDTLEGTISENARDRMPVPKAAIDVRSARNESTLIASTRTDEKGWFSFGSIASGKYLLDVRSEFAPSYRLIVKSRGKKKGSSILVRLGPDCHQTEATVSK
jgi:hypothetical protein